MFTAHSFNVDDQQFMNALYEKYHRIMYAIVMRYISDPHDCEDILQDAIENLCGKVTKLRELTERGQYLYITATVKNTAINLRKHQRIVERYIQIAIGNPPLLPLSYESGSQSGFSPASHRACDFHRTRRSINADFLLRVCEVTSFSL